MVRVVVDAIDVIVLGVGVVGLLLCGVVLAAVWVKQELEKRRNK